MEERLGARARAVHDGMERYLVPLPYVIAEVPKGYGFPGAGTNAAHNLPIGEDVRGDAAARQRFNAGARGLWVPAEELKRSVRILKNHEETRRPLEKDHPLATRSVSLQRMPEPEWHEPKDQARTSPMLGAIRQEIIFARHQREIGRPAGWLGIPVLATSHAWENAKNEMSHQDPTFAETLMGEMSDVSRVVFPADWNTAIASLKAVYQSHGQIWTLVPPKYPVPETFTRDEAERLVNDAALSVRQHGDAQAILVAIGGYQLWEAMKASDRLMERGINNLVYIIEPARYRSGRDELEAEVLLSRDDRERLFPSAVKPRVFISHTRPEPIVGILRTLDTGPEHTRFLGFLNRGGTLDVFGMLFANRCTWGHTVAATAEIIGRPTEDLLSPEEWNAVRGQGDPQVLRGE